MKKKKIVRTTTEFMADVVIEKGIPVPPERKRGIQFPFENMEVGDSFYQDIVSANSVRNKAREYAKNNLNPDGSMPVFILVDERSGTRCFRKK